MTKKQDRVAEAMRLAPLLSTDRPALVAAFREMPPLKAAVIAMLIHKQVSFISRGNMLDVLEEALDTPEGK